MIDSFVRKICLLGLSVLSPAGFLCGGGVSASEPVQSVRADAENRFIAGLRGWPGTTADDEADFDVDLLEETDDGLLRLPGKYYHIPYVTTDTYYYEDDDLVVQVLYDVNFPAESIANIFLLPLDEARKTQLDLTVLTHEYGTKTRCVTTVDKFVSYCETSGCKPFFGVEKIEGDFLEGAVFMYNPVEGYDHVLKLDCNVREVIEEGAPISARISLFVPTGNVENLFQKRPDGPSEAKRQLDMQFPGQQGVVEDSDSQGAKGNSSPKENTDNNR